MACTNPESTKSASQHIIPVFKTLPSIQQITLKLGVSKLLIELHCSHDTKKIYKLNIEECEVMHAVYNLDNYPLKITCDAKMLSEHIANFPNAISEVTATSDQENLNIKSFYDEEQVDLKTLLTTSMDISNTNFESIERQSDDAHIQATFNIKNFKGFLWFAEASSQNIVLCFGSSKIPVVFYSDSKKEDLKGLLLLANIPSSDEELSQPPSQSQRASDTCGEVQRNTTSNSSNGAAPRRPESVSSFSNAGTPQRPTLSSHDQRTYSSSLEQPRFPVGGYTPQHYDHEQQGYAPMEEDGNYHHQVEDDKFNPESPPRRRRNKSVEDEDEVCGTPSPRDYANDEDHGQETHEDLIRDQKPGFDYR
eukprot:GEZU01019526.1.p1 GENE.GEZU01019526.1~~GEZU01019526.1.p1  ORF type:complete len:364 (+),score=62.18 GEZU01019526.1:315-1406(+)